MQTPPINGPSYLHQYNKEDTSSQVSSVIQGSEERPSIGKEKAPKYFDTDDLHCPIRRLLMRKAVSLFCGHSFEEEAIVQWFTKSKGKICPVCRAESSGYFPNRFLQNTIDAYREKHPEEEDKEQLENVTRPTPPIRKVMTKEEVAEGSL